MPARSTAEPNPYDRRHQQLRARLLPKAIGTLCPGKRLADGTRWHSTRCIRVMTNPALMHLDHWTPVAHGGTRGNEIICAPCNEGAGAVLRNQAKGRRHAARRTRSW